MEEKATQLLEQLAAKLGTTVDKILEVYLAQAQVEIVIYSVWVAFFLVTAVPATKLVIKAIRVMVECGEDEIVKPVSNGLVIIFTFVFYLVLFIAILAEMRTAITQLFNPEYWVMTEIFKLVM